MGGVLSGYGPFLSVGTLSIHIALLNRRRPSFWPISRRRANKFCYLGIRRKYFFNIFKKHGYSFMSISDSSSVLRTKSRAVPPFITFFALFWLRRRFQAIAFQLINLHIQELQETLS
jgi:hypothetical protein